MNLITQALIVLLALNTLFSSFVEKSPDQTPPKIDPYTPYSYERVQQDTKALSEYYPELIQLDSIGMSVEGRDLTLIKLGKGDNKILLVGSHHAREYISSAFLMKMIEEYALAYSTGKKLDNYDVVKLLDEFTVYIVPMLNPDGVNLVQNGIDSVIDVKKVKSIKLKWKSYRSWKSNINGVDLNRNYPVEWEKIKNEFTVPTSEGFKGKKPASEPEVQAVINLCHDNDFLLAVSFHTKGELLFWADRGTYKQISAAKAIADNFVKLTGYIKMPVSQNPSVYGGGLENWFRKEFLRPGFCVELTPHDLLVTPHNDKNFDALVWKKAKLTGLFFMDEALSIEIK